MEEIKERIKKIRSILNLSQRDFSKRIYISQALLGDIELGKRKVNDRTVQLISTQFNINRDWLITGSGEIFTAPPPDIQLEELIDIFKQLDKSLKSYFLELSKILLKMQNENTTKD